MGAPDRRPRRIKQAGAASAPQRWLDTVSPRRPGSHDRPGRTLRRACQQRAAGARRLSRWPAPPGLRHHRPAGSGGRAARARWPRAGIGLRGSRGRRPPGSRARGLLPGPRDPPAGARPSLRLRRAATRLPGTAPASSRRTLPAARGARARSPASPRPPAVPARQPGEQRERRRVR